ncbi:MAG: DegT/DnrJ/EryC1/StrS family aminotransferase [Burkholderiales bacterium]|nr:MAG: DegT/DnrJ/EryC1/StrS family aminotransferase [Burkholderiales bacterium]
MTQSTLVRPEIPLLDLKSQWRALRDEILPAIEAVCESQHFILGPNVAALEREIADYSQSAHGIGTSSGTDALLLALMALGVGPGDAVLTSPYSFFATAGTIARLGARPVFCDIDADTCNLSPAAVRATIERDCERRDGALWHRPSGARIRALMPVHLYGQCADMDALAPIAAEHELPIIEDAAQAIGAEVAGGRRAGALGTIGCFSFFPSKNLGAFGDAGLCTAADPALAERMRVLRVHGGKPKYHHAVIGANLRLDELQAAVLRVKLRHLDAWTEARRANAARYDAAFRAAGLDGAIGLPAVRDGYRHVFNQYVIRSPRRDALRAHLAAERIGTEVYYPVPLHLQACFAPLGYAPGDCPQAEAAANCTLALPVHPDLEPEQLQAVVDAVAAFHE